MDNLKGSLGIRWTDEVPNPRIRELCGVTKVVGEGIDEDAPRWIGHVEEPENDRIAKMVYVGECTGSPSVEVDRYLEGLLEKRKKKV